MNKGEIIEELIANLSLLSNDGLPNLKSERSVGYIYEFFESKGMVDFGRMVIENLFEDDKEFKNPELNKVISYTNVNGKKAEGKVGNLLRRPKEEDAYIQAVAALGGKQSDRYKTAMDDLGSEGQPNRDIEKEREKGKESGEEGGGEEPQTGTALDPQSKGGAAYLKGLPDTDPAKPADMKDDSEETLSAGGVVYPVGGGYYADTPDGEPKYRKATDENVDITDFRYILEAESAVGKRVIKKPVDGDGETKPMVVIGDKEKENAETDIGEFEKIPPATLKAKKSQLEDARRRMEAGEHDENTKKAYDIFEENINKLLNAKTEEEQIEAIRTLADNGFLKRNGNGQKLYVSNLPLPSKQITGQSGDKLGIIVNRLAEENEIDIPLRDESVDRMLANTSGLHNEAGVVAILDPSEENVNQYDVLKGQYADYGGDEEAAHKQNEAAADEINSEIQKQFPGGKVKKATQVGGIGPEKLKQLGIDPKKDPTDILIEIEMPDGTTQYMKISMKVYADPSSITMKNSGMGDAGSHYLGAPEIDEQLKALREKHNYLEPGISSQEFEKRKREFRVAYLTLFSQKMEELSKTPEGQEKLMEMWKEVHGCGNDVYTSVTNKKTGETKVHKPEHYCEPEIPFKVEYDGVKVSIRMGGETDSSFLEIVCKTESIGSPKILFNHKKSKK
jgi:hypothetical protein